MVTKAEKLEITHRIDYAKLKWQFDAYFGEVKRRLLKENKARGDDRAQFVDQAWEESWRVFQPAVEKSEKDRKKQDTQQTAPATIPGMPDRTTDDILDPEYAEPNRAKQLRDGLLWAAMEFDRVIEDTNDGPVAHLEDASIPPPNAFAIGIMRTYALSPVDKRHTLITRALAFASKDTDQPEDNPEDDAFLHELD